MARTKLFHTVVVVGSSLLANCGGSKEQPPGSVPGSAEPAKPVKAIDAAIVADAPPPVDASAPADAAADARAPIDAGVHRRPRPDAAALVPTQAEPPPGPARIMAPPPPPPRIHARKPPGPARIHAKPPKPPQIME